MIRLRVAAPAAAVVGALVTAAVLAGAPDGHGGGSLMPAASPAGTPATTALDGDGLDGSEPPLPSLPVGAVAAGYGAAGSGPAGVPLGFTRSAVGAAAAATAWLATVEGAGVLDERRRGPVLAAIGDPAFVRAASARLADRGEALGLDASGQPQAGYVMAVVWAARGAYRVVDYDAGSARVEIWHLYQLGVVPPGAQPAPGRWRRATVSLRWDDGAGDWRLSTDITVADGPDPQVADPSPMERAAVLAPLGAGWQLYTNGQ